MEDLNKEIKEAEEALAKLKKKKEEFDALSDDKKLADLIHSKMCHWNHTDGCGYFYESWDKMFQPGSRMPYLNKARAILKITDYETAVKVISQL